MDFVPALKEMMIKYDFYKSNLKNYSNTASKMTQKYLDLFERLFKNKKGNCIKKKNF